MKRLGSDLEDYIAKRLGEVEAWAGTTINSGAVRGDADVASPMFQTECKDNITNNKKNFNISRGDWRKLQASALRERTPTGDYRIGIFVVRNMYSEVTVTLDLEDFLAMVEKMNKE